LPPDAASIAAPLVNAHQEAAPRYAGFWRRLLAWLVDSLVMNVAFFVALLLIGVIAQLAGGGDRLGRRDAPPPPGQSGTLEYAAIALFVGVPLIIGWLYYAGCESSRAQATLGKLAAGVRVEDIDGGRATFVQTSVRFWVKLISAAIAGIGFLMICFTSRRQALHDIGANTIVTRRPTAPPPHFRPAL